MKIFPAIDIIDKHVVRLQMGDYNKKTIYSDRPEDIARQFYDVGARYLHVVDLDGAKNKSPINFDTVVSIIKSCPIKVEIGGGIRDEQSVEKYLNAGAMRVILGTAAITDLDFLKHMTDKYRDKVIVGLDIKNQRPAINGWLEYSNDDCFEVLKSFKNAGVKTVICTDITKDGMLKGVDAEFYKKLIDSSGLDIVASGGITSIDDIKKVSQVGCAGAILGKALYTGKIELESVLEVAGVQ